MLPSNKNRFQTILVGLNDLVSKGNSPVYVIRSALNLWASNVAPFSCVDLGETNLLSQEHAIATFSHWLGETDLLTGAFWLSSAYASLISKEHRKKSAMYFTPPYLSNRMLDNAGQNLFKGKLIDPACGGAAFLAAAAQRITKHLESSGYSSAEIVEYLESNLYGSDTDPFLCELSEAFLQMILDYHLSQLGRKPKFHIFCGDGLSSFEAQVGLFQLVLSNPPYRKMGKHEVANYLDANAEVIQGQPNLYTLFINRASRLAAPGGQAIMLTPMSYLSGSSFSKLRSFIANNGHVSQLDLIHNKNGVFLGAEQDAVVTVWNKIKPISSKTKVYSLTPSDDSRFIGELLISNPAASWPVPRRPGDEDLLQLLGGQHAKLSDYGYKAKTGAIVVHRDPRRRFSHFPHAKKPKCNLPLIWSKDIRQTGCLELRSPAVCHDRFIELENLGSSACISRPAIALQRVTSSEQLKRICCAPVPEELYTKYGGVTGENHVCFIESNSSVPIVDPTLLSDILRTDVMDRLFRCISGATNVSVYELNQLPLPDIEVVRNALRDGKSIETAVRLGLSLKEQGQ